MGLYFTHLKKSILASGFFLSLVQSGGTFKALQTLGPTYVKDCILLHVFRVPPTGLCPLMVAHFVSSRSRALSRACNGVHSEGIFGREVISGVLVY